MSGARATLCGLAAGVFALLAPLAAPAQETTPRGTWSFTLENDLIGGTDQDYTNGAMVSYVGPKNDLPAPARWARENLRWLTPAEKWHVTYGLGQNMYTPQDISAEVPDPTDRPYAGFLYGSIGLAADSRRADGSPRRLDVFALDVGVVGEASLAEPAQILVHKVIGVQRPEGWDEQLSNEIAFRLLYERNWRASAKWDLPFLPLELDATPNVGLALGTVETYAAVGVSLRMGEDLGDDYGPPRVRPALASPGFFQNADGFGWYIFGGVQGRAVGRDLFIEGNTFKDSPGVDLEPFQMDVQAGLAVQLGGVEVAFTHVLRSPQHTERGRWNRFGSVNVRARF